MFLGRILKKKGGRVVFIFPEQTSNFEWANDLINEGELIFFIDASFFSKRVKFANINYVKDIVRTYKIDIIHTHFIDLNLTLLLLSRMLGSKTKIIGHFHNLYLPPVNKYKNIKRMLTELTFDLIIGVSSSVSDSLIDSGINTSKVKTLPNGIDFERLEKFESLEFRDNSRQKVIMSIGWPFYIKGIDTVIQAISNINMEFESLILLVALSGARREFEDSIRNQLGLIPSWIKILEARDDIATYYNNSDIFLSASRQEGFSYSLVEAAYCNPLLISSNISAPVSLGIPYLFTFKVGDPYDLKDKIENALGISVNDKILYKKAQQSYAVDTYSLDIWSRGMLTYYGTLMS